MLYTDLNSTTSEAYDAAAINNALRNIIFTPIGTLPGNPTFGSDIHKIIFSQMDTVTENILKRYINEAISRWERRIILLSINVEKIPEFNSIIVTLRYQYRDKGILMDAQSSFNLLENS